MKIHIAADHAGLDLKNILVSFLKDDLGFEVVDKGAYTYNATDDYPDFIRLVAENVAAAPENARGIILGGSGQGEAMTANRYPGVRAAVYYGGPRKLIILSREHNNANILSLGARFLSAEEAKEAVRLWLETPFSGDERHKRRIKKIDS